MNPLCNYCGDEAPSFPHTCTKPSLREQITGLRAKIDAVRALCDEFEAEIDIHSKVVAAQFRAIIDGVEVTK